MKINLDDVERNCLEWNTRLDKPWIADDERVHLNGRAMLELVAIARAALAVRVARRDGLRGDHAQDVHDALARALDAAGLSARPPSEATPAVETVAALAGTGADVSAALNDPVPNPQPDDRDLILEVIHDLDRRVLQAQADGYSQVRDVERAQSAALRRLLSRADDFLGWYARGGVPTSGG